MTVESFINCDQGVGLYKVFVWLLALTWTSCAGAEPKSTAGRTSGCDANLSTVSSAERVMAGGDETPVFFTLAFRAVTDTLCQIWVATAVGKWENKTDERGGKQMCVYFDGEVRMHFFYASDLRSLARELSKKCDVNRTSTECGGGGQGGQVNLEMGTLLLILFILLMLCWGGVKKQAIHFQPVNSTYKRLAWESKRQHDVRWYREVELSTTTIRGSHPYVIQPCSP